MHEKKERQEEVRSTESEIGPAGSGSIEGRCSRESAFTRHLARSSTKLFHLCINRLGNGLSSVETAGNVDPRRVGRP